MASTPPAALFVPTRAYPRLQYATPVEVRFCGRTLMGTTEDIAIGGLGARCEEPPPQASKLELLFNLPTGFSVRTDGIVRYVLPGRFGVQFTGLPEDARHALEEYTRKVLGYVRRGGRVVQRLHVTLRSSVSGATDEQLAETVILSRSGGRAICRARFKIGEELRLYWPETHREATIRIVLQQLCGTGELIDLGFEFIDTENFWGMDFPS